MNTNTNSKPPAAGEAAHTPTPWTVQGAEIRATGREFPTIICDPFSGQWENEGGDVCRLLPIDEREANAAFIVRACNAHAGLLEALEGLLAAVNDSATAGFHMGYSKEIEQASAALNSAKE